jgi:hypothetical protein
MFSLTGYRIMVPPSLLTIANEVTESAWVLLRLLTADFGPFAT